MKIPKLYKIILLSLIPILVMAAAIFDPNYVTSSYAIQPVGYVGSPIASGYNLTSGDKSIYIIDYSSQNWSGNLHSYSLSSSGVVGSADQWTNGAATAIDSQNEVSGAWTSTGRKIVTMSGSTKIAFLWGNLSSAQKTALDSASSSSSSSPVLNYIRGERVNEKARGGTYRDRATVLGDIIHSTPRYWDDGTNKTIFVGANDGMLHAINATNGSERFAYIPSVLISKLSTLKTDPYAHKFFVDGQLAAIKYGTQSILAGGLGGGGKGLFALDITAVPTTEADAASKILWEITNATSGFENLGHTYSTPVLTTITGGTKALIVGNGYNNTGNYHSSLFIINPLTGAKLSEIDAGSGTALSPNGLSSPTLVDTDGDFKMDYAYAGDIDGNLWKFDLSAKTATKLYTASQPITIAPGVKKHPNGGYMITFVTGRIFEAADESDNNTHYAYGIWDKPAAYATNDTLLSQTLTESNYTYTTSGGSTETIRVRTASKNIPDWTPGAGHHMGWKTPLPITGERVVGDGAFVNGSVFLFLSANPTINPTLIPPGDNWWMQLNALTGGDNGAVFFDLNADGKFTSADNVTVSSASTSPVGRNLGGGVRSQLTAFSTAGFDIYLANYDRNGDPPSGSGVANGHFDEDIYFGSLSPATSATATITVGATGQTSPFPATLGAITVDGVVVVPAMTVADIPDGTASSTNATTIKNKVTNGFTATKSGNVITITAPSGASYNSKTIAIADGTSQTLVYPAAAIPAVAAVPAVAYVAPVAAVARVNPTGLITFSGSNTNNSSPTPVINNDLTGSQSVILGSINVAGNAISIGKNKTPAQTASSVVSAIGTNGTVKAYIGGNNITPTCQSKTNNVVCLVDTTATVTNGKSISVGTRTNFGTMSVSTTATAGGVAAAAAVAEVLAVAAVPASPYVPAVPRSGWTNFKPALTTTPFSGGTDVATVGDNCTYCSKDTHVHQYDDRYDVTGVNYLNPSDIKYNLARAIGPTEPFKVIAQNQYLNPAITINIGHSDYQFNVNAGYTSIKDFITSSTLDLSTLPSYTLSTVGSLVVNMPVDALTAKNWWGNGDVRAGLHPAPPSCVYESDNTHDGNMYQPVIPPANGTDGPGVKGWTNTTTPATATGARHGGALVIQIIRASTPNSAIEQNVAGRPEYGWRVKSALYSQYVLAEYNTWWHHPNGKCYGDTGWTKNPGADNGSSSTTTKAVGSTDPHIGSLGAATAGTTTTTVTNADGSTTTTTITIVINASGGATVTTTITNSNGGSTTTVLKDGIAVGGAVGSDGNFYIPPDCVTNCGLSSPLIPLGRVNWRELFR